MSRYKVLLILHSMVLLLSVSFCNAYLSTASFEMNLGLCANRLNRLTLGGNLFKMFLNEGGMRTLNFSSSRNFLDLDQVDLFETCIGESIVKKMIVGAKEISLLSHEKPVVFNYYGACAALASLAVICGYGGYRFYKNLNTKKKGLL